MVDVLKSSIETTWIDSLSSFDSMASFATLIIQSGSLFYTN